MNTFFYSSEKMLYLLANGENLIWEEIKKYTDSSENAGHSIEYIKYMIECYISLSKKNNELLPYHTIKDFFCLYNEDGEVEYDKFLSYKSTVNEDFEQNEELFWINHIKLNACTLIRKVLSDSESDPHYSAVYISNTIKCIIQVLKELGKNPFYSDVKTFFTIHKFTLDEYKAFERIKEKESVYYRGIQY